jgi:hypothetical protein
MEEALGGVQEESGGHTCNFPSVSLLSPFCSGPLLFTSLSNCKFAPDLDLIFFCTTGTCTPRPRPALSSFKFKICRAGVRQLALQAGYPTSVGWPPLQLGPRVFKLVSTFLV